MSNLTITANGSNSKNFSTSNAPISSETPDEYILVNKEESRFWLSLFLKNFLSLNASRKDHDEDDLLFFIRKKPTKLFQQYEVISVKCSHC